MIRFLLVPFFFLFFLMVFILDFFKKNYRARDKDLTILKLILHGYNVQLKGEVFLKKKNKINNNTKKSLKRTQLDLYIHMEFLFKYNKKSNSIDDRITSTFLKTGVIIHKNKRENLHVGFFKINQLDYAHHTCFIMLKMKCTCINRISLYEQNTC